MKKLRELILRFGGLFAKERRERELDEEIESHLYEKLRDEGRSLSGLFAGGGVREDDRLTIPGGGEAEVEFVRAQPVSGNFFSVLGVSAVLYGCAKLNRQTPPSEEPVVPQPPGPIEAHPYSWQNRAK